MFVKLLMPFLIGVVISQVNAKSDKEKLVGDLLKDYMKGVDPGDTPLRMGLSFTCTNLDSETGLLTSKLWEKYTWQDSRLKWNPADHSNIKIIRLPSKLIWTPDVKLYNSEGEAEIRDDVNTVIFSNGTVIWVPPVVYKTRCTVQRDEKSEMANDVRSASCKLKLGSWTYDADQLDLQLDGTGFDAYAYLETCPYIISDAKVEVESQRYPCCPEKYASLNVSFRIHRHDD